MLSWRKPDEGLASEVNSVQEWHLVFSHTLVTPQVCKSCTLQKI